METFLNQLAQFAVGNIDRIDQLVETVDDWRTATDAEVARLVELLPEVVAGSDLKKITPVLVRAVENLAIREREQSTSALAESTRSLLLVTYRKLPAGNDLRPYILRMFASAGDEASLADFAQTMVDDPPAKSEHATLALVPLAQQPQEKTFEVESLYPTLLDAVAHRSAATAVLDITNYLARHYKLDPHPATDRVARLAKLVEAVTAELEKLEQPQVDPAARETVGESVELAVALCDTLAMAGDQSVVGKLFPLLEIKHRRLQAEAASAVARLGEEQGLDHLAALAEHAVVRTRALAYLDELDAVERVDEEFRSADARAEGELAAWLAEPAQFGFPPQRIELVDRQLMHWPGYDDAVECFLYQYVYPTPQGDLTGIGIAGPAVHSFAVDLHELEPDEMFGAFAGWATEHEDCKEIPTSSLDGPRQVRMQQASSALETLGYTNIEPVQLGMFFGKELAVFSAIKDGAEGTVIVDPEEEQDERTRWIAAGLTPRPIGPDVAYKIYIGQLLLQSFNP
jgi:hypothetical protein